MGSSQVLPLRVKVDPGVMAMKAYSTLLKPPELEPHHQMQFTVIPKTPFLGGREVWLTPPAGDSVSVF